MEGDTYTFPEHLRVFGEEARHLHQQVMSELQARPSFESASNEPLLNVAPALMQRMAANMERFIDVLHGPITTRQPVTTTVRFIVPWAEWSNC